MDDDSRLSQLTGQLVGLLQGYMEQHGLDGLGYLLHRDALVAVTDDGGVMFTTARPSAAWRGFVRLSDLPGRSNLRSISTMFDDIPPGIDIQQIREATLNLLGARAIDRLAVEAANKIFPQLQEPIAEEPNQLDAMKQSRPTFVRWMRWLMWCALISMGGSFGGIIGAVIALFIVTWLFNATWTPTLPNYAIVVLAPLVFLASVVFNLAARHAISQQVLSSLAAEQPASIAKQASEIVATQAPIPTQMPATEAADVSSDVKAFEAAQQQRWNADVAATFRSHPELLYGHNTRVFQEKLYQVATRGMSNSEMLRLAYASSRNDSRWAQTP